MSLSTFCSYNGLLSCMSGCSTTQDYSSARQQVIALEGGGLSRDGPAFLTPTTVTGKAVGMRYIAQLKLSDFPLYSRDRFSAIGIRLLETKQAHVRAFLQIWDVSKGTITWKAVESLLINLGCNVGQGYHYSPPVPADIFESLLLREERSMSR
ncbi:MAG: hypothetical protein RPV21_15485 [Candidatus Sedimenticola sp. (ex Thyasira tokunagai)]